MAASSTRPDDPERRVPESMSRQIAAPAVDTAVAMLRGQIAMVRSVLDQLEHLVPATGDDAPMSRRGQAVVTQLADELALLARRATDASARLSDRPPPPPPRDDSRR